jgi:hypothetical protein
MARRNYIHPRHSSIETSDKARWTFQYDVVMPVRNNKHANEVLGQDLQTGRRCVYRIPGQRVPAPCFRFHEITLLRPCNTALLAHYVLTHPPMGYIPIALKSYAVKQHAHEEATEDEDNKNASDMTAEEKETSRAFLAQLRGPTHSLKDLLNWHQFAPSIPWPASDWQQGVMLLREWKLDLCTKTELQTFHCPVSNQRFPFTSCFPIWSVPERMKLAEVLWTQPHMTLQVSGIEQPSSAFYFNLEDESLNDAIIRAVISNPMEDACMTLQSTRQQQLLLLQSQSHVVSTTQYHPDDMIYGTHRCVTCWKTITCCVHEVCTNEKDRPNMQPHWRQKPVPEKALPFHAYRKTVTLQCTDELSGKRTRVFINPDVDSTGNVCNRPECSNQRRRHICHKCNNSWLCPDAQKGSLRLCCCDEEQRAGRMTCRNCLRWYHDDY